MELKPARNGAVDPIADYPRKRYNDIRAMEKKPVFIRARFLLDGKVLESISGLLRVSPAEAQTVEVSRDYDNKIYVDFPDIRTRRIEAPQVLEVLHRAATELEVIEVKSEAGLKARMLETLHGEHSRYSAHAELDRNDLTSIRSSLDAVDLSDGISKSVIVPRFEQVRSDIEGFQQQLEPATPEDRQKARDTAWAAVPTFVYYSNYGNLDSEIYLPHVIENMERTDLGSKEEAKVRTLRVLFDFVRLSPSEILELGREVETVKDQPTEEEIAETAHRKKEREILLQSASTELTGKFRDWWKQGDYRIRFQADGDHFRIWVSDDKRPEEIELEGRSTGLQWFLSFYLIFLVESKEAHQNAILLLDEPGLSLHPLAQRDLSHFFENLTKTNQILFTTHSPFLVDSDHLDRVKAVYTNQEGATEISSDLRVTETDASQSKSIYPVYAALGLSVSNTLLQGCEPVIVEGPSDQIYLSAIKNILSSQGRLAARRELVFVPAGGVRGVKAVISILTGKDEALPFVLLDSDFAGKDLAKKLRQDFYSSHQDRILETDAFCKLSGSEIEDLVPRELVAKAFDKLFGIRDVDVADILTRDEAIVPQLKQFAAENGISLPDGWKVELARAIKTRMLLTQSSFEPELVAWEELFGTLHPHDEKSDSEDRVGSKRRGRA